MQRMRMKRPGQPIVRATMAALVVVVLAGGSAAGTSARTALPVRPELEAQLSGGEPVIVLVTGETAEHALRAVEASGLRAVEVLDRFSMVAAAGPPQGVRAVHRQPGVRRVDANLKLEPLDDVAHRATGVAALRDAGTTPQLDGLRRPDGTPYDGKGVSIAVVDGGFDGTHEQFVEGGVSKFDVHLRQGCPPPREFVLYATGADPSPDCSVWLPVTSGDDDDDYGHGTIVAAAAAGYPRTTPSGKTVSGVAPGARLVGLSIGAGAAFYNAFSALNWVLEHHADPCGDGSCAPIRVVNASWGLAADDALFARRFDPDSPIGKVTTALVEDGVVVAFAAGNDGGDGSKAMTNYFALNPLPGALMVGAYDDGNAGDRDMLVADFSSNGKAGEAGTYPDLLAPGVNLSTACAPGTFLCSAGPGLDGDYGTFSGTSLSAPYLAGVVAILLEADPSLTPAEIEDILEDSAYQLGPPGHLEPDVYVDSQGHTRGNPDHLTSFDAGHGNVDIVGALSNVLKEKLGTWPDPCPHDSTVTLDDPSGDTRLLYQRVLVQQPDLDVVEVAASLDATPGALSVVVTYDDMPELATTPMHTTVAAYIDRGGSLGPTHGQSVEVDLDRSLAGDMFSVFRGAVAVEGAVDPVADTATFVIRPLDGPIETRASVTFIWTSTRSTGFIGDADVTDGACTVWVS